MKTLSLALASLTLLAANTTEAQVYCPPCVSGPGYRAARVYVGSPHHASTAAESYARGYADLVRARGQYNVLVSQAMLNLAEARRRETENRVAQTEAYFRMREINRSHRSADRATQPPDYAASNPSRITDGRHECRPVGLVLREGRIAWPKALEDGGFVGYRAVVEQVLERRIASGAESELDRSSLTQASRAMTSMLRDRIREYSPQDYVDAKRFLAALPSLLVSAQGGRTARTEGL